MARWGSQGAVWGVWPGTVRLGTAGAADAAGQCSGWLGQVVCGAVRRGWAGWAWHVEVRSGESRHCVVGRGWLGSQGGVSWG